MITLLKAHVVPLLPRPRCPMVAPASLCATLQPVSCPALNFTPFPFSPQIENPLSLSFILLLCLHVPSSYSFILHGFLPSTYLCYFNLNSPSLPSTFQKSPSLSFVLHPTHPLFSPLLTPLTLLPSPHLSSPFHSSPPLLCPAVQRAWGRAYDQPVHRKRVLKHGHLIRIGGNS